MPLTVYVLRLDAGHEIADEELGGEAVGLVAGVVGVAGVVVVPAGGGGGAPPPTSLQFVVYDPSGAVS